MAGRSEVSCNDGTFAVGAFAAAPPAIAKDTPAAPNAGKPIRRRFRLETCFVRAIVKPPGQAQKVAHKARTGKEPLSSGLTPQTSGRAEVTTSHATLKYKKSRCGCVKRHRTANLSEILWFPCGLTDRFYLRFLILSSSVIRTTRMPDNHFLFVRLCARFAAGYGVREYMSRKRHRRAREQAGY